MCEANAFLVEDDQEKMIMEGVDLVQPLDEDQWRLVNIFGEQKTIRARMKRMALGQHKLFFSPAP